MRASCGFAVHRVRYGMSASRLCWRRSRPSWGRNGISCGETLLHVAELLVEARPMAAAVGILSGQGELERRVAGLINPRRNTRTRTGRMAACVVMFMFIAGGVMLSATRFAAQAS